MKSFNSFLIPALKTARRLAGAVLCALLILVAAFVAPPTLYSQTAPALLFVGTQTTVGSGLNDPSGVALDAAGNLFIADSGNNRVIEISTNGSTSTILDTGLNSPFGVAVDANDDVYIADTYNSRVVEVSSSGVQTSVGSGLHDPYGVAVDTSGDVFIADTYNARVVEVSASGTQRTVVSGVGNPVYVAVDGAGDLFVGASSVAFEITAAGSQISLGTGLIYPNGIAVDKAGDIFITDAGTQELIELPAGGAQITLATGFNAPHEVAVDSTGRIFVADSLHNRIVEIQRNAANFGAANVCPTGKTTPAPCSQTLSLTYGITAATTIGSVEALTQGASKLDFTVPSNTCTGILSAGSSCAVTVQFAPKAPGIRMGAVRLTYSTGETPESTKTPIFGQGFAPEIAFGPGTQTTITSGNLFPLALAADAAGDIFIAAVAGDDYLLEEIPAGGGTPITLTTGSEFGGTSPAPFYPSGVTVDGAGDVFIAFLSGTILKVPAGGGTPATFASGADIVQGLAVDAAGDVFFGDLSTDDIMEVPVYGGSPLVIAQNVSPQSVAVDAGGDIFFSNGGTSVEEIPAGGGNPITVAGGLQDAQQLAIDAAGDILVADRYNTVVVEVPAGGGAQTTLGSGLSDPFGVAVDGAGDVFIADSGHDRVLKINRSSAPAFTFTTGVDIGTTKPLTLQDVGNQLLNAIAPGLTIGKADFRQTAASGALANCTSAFSLAPGASCDLHIAFTPTAVSTVKSSLVLTDNSLNGKPAKQTISLTGNGVLLKPLVQVSAGPFTYNGLSQSASCTVTGEGGISVPGSCAFTYNGSSTAPTNAGSYIVVVTFTSSDPSYANSSTTVTMVIDKAPLTITANGAVYLQGGTFPTFTVSYSGLVDEQSQSVLTGTLEITSTGTSGSALGDYPIVPSGVTSTNYAITYVDGTLAILPSSGLAGLSYNIQNVNSGLYLGVQGASMSDGADIVQSTADGSFDQDWQLIRLKNGAYQIRDVNSGLYIAVPGASTSAGTALVQWQADTNADQQWQFTPVGSNWLITNVNSGMLMTIEGDSTTAGTQVIQGQANGSTSQVFTLIPLQ